MFKRFSADNASRPTVKKVSELINTKSHKQKKYISLMVVPSYSTGKTRSLRVPRALFHGVLASLLIVTAVVTGFYLRSNHLMNVAQNLEAALHETEETFSEFRAYAEQVQDDLIETASQIYAELNEVEGRAQDALDEKAEVHRTELEIILEQIEEIERAIRELDEGRQAMMAGLSARAEIIPPIAGILAQLEAAEAALRQSSLLHMPAQEQIGVGLLGGVATAYVPATHDSVQEHLYVLAQEMDIQRLLMENLEAHQALMSVYLLNFPTLWPISGPVSSEFGWRRNPFGGFSSEHHDGIDIRGAAGTIIRAAGGGTVTFEGWRNGYGNTVVIYHGNGIETLYAHNTSNSVSVGDVVARGDVIGRVGRTGRATGNHVHYEVIINGIPVNPRPFLNEFYS